MTPQQRVIVLALSTAIALPMEGTRQWAYRDVTGLPTICMGSTTGVKMGDFRTLPECNALLDKDMLHAITIVEQCVPGLPAPVLAAFADLTYNVGPAAVCNQSKSTAARLLAAGKFREACEQLPRWSNAIVGGVAVSLPGLVKRRKLEMELCLQGAGA